MVNYDRLAILPQEEAQLQLCKRTAPFRQWYAVKAVNIETRYFDSRRKALTFARKHPPAAIYA